MEITLEKTKMAKGYLLMLFLAMVAQVLVCGHHHQSDDFDNDKGMDLALHRVRRQAGNAQVLNRYMQAVLDTFKRQMFYGVPLLNIPKLDPYSIKDLSIDKNDEKRKLHVKMYQQTVAGLAKFQITKIDLDLNDLRFTLGLRIPKLTVKGKYNLKGKLFNILPLYGSGDFSVSVKELTISTSVAVTIDENGKGTLAEPPNLDVSFRTATVDFQHLLGDLSNFLNNIINALSRPIFNKMKPKLMGSLKKSLFKVLNKQLQKIDLSKFLG